MRICHPDVFFGEGTVKVLAHLFFSVGLFVFLLLSIKSSLCIFSNSSLSAVSSANVFSLFVASPHSLHSVFQRVEVVHFNKAQLIYFFLYGLCFWGLQLKTPHQTQGPLDFLLCYLLEVTWFCVLHLGL